MKDKIRIPYGILSKLARVSGHKINYLSDLAATRKRPGRIKAKQLERECLKLGINIPAEIWLYGSENEIKSAMKEDNYVRTTEPI